MQEHSNLKCANCGRVVPGLMDAGGTYPCFSCGKETTWIPTDEARNYRPIKWRRDQEGQRPDIGTKPELDDSSGSQETEESKSLWNILNILLFVGFLVFLVAVLVQSVA